MMDSPFFRSYRQPRYSSALSVSAREIPVQGNTKTNTKPSHKVISIPVHYVGSERIRSNSALKIQKVLRGFLVRKNMKRITAIRNQVDEIERRVSGLETLELILKDGKERLRVNETIMNLLLRLDSVRSIDSGVRACRKCVINKAIALQEKVDQISSADHTVNAECFSEPLEVKDSMHGGDVSQEQNLELQCEAAEDISEGQAPQNHDKKPQRVNADSDSNSIVDDPTSELRQHVELMPISVPSAGPLVAEIVPNAESEVASQSPKLEALIDTHSPSLKDEGQMEIEAKQNDIKDSAHEGRSAEQSGTSTAAKTSLIEESEENSSVKEKNRTNVVQSDEPGMHIEENFQFGRGDEQNRSRDLLERMIQDKERMMNLMAQLFEKNERQTRLLSSLSNRVEQLEKAFACEKSRRKKRRNAAGIADAPDKCGKR